MVNGLEISAMLETMPPQWSEPQHSPLFSGIPPFFYSISHFGMLKYFFIQVLSLLI